MIIVENVTINGRDFIRTYSDQNMMIEREGIRYSEAYDPAEIERHYTETNEPIPQEHEEEEENNSEHELNTRT